MHVAARWVGTQRRHRGRSWSSKKTTFAKAYGARRAPYWRLDACFPPLLLHVHYFNQIAHTCVLFWRLRPVLDGARALRARLSASDCRRAAASNSARETTPLYCQAAVPLPAPPPGRADTGGGARRRPHGGREGRRHGAKGEMVVAMGAGENEFGPY